MSLVSKEGSATLAAGPPPYLVHGALVATQVLFGAGSVVGSLGLPAFNPLLFAMIRELCAGALLFAASVIMTGIYPTASRPHWGRFALLGITIFGNQACFIIGLKLSNPIAGSIWQPSQPVMTAGICMFLGLEPLSWVRVGGVVLAFAGCAVMVALSAKASPSGVAQEVAGNVFFFVNCLSTALYVILSKDLLGRYPPICVTAWSYLGASVIMTTTTAALSTSPQVVHFLCPDCRGAWHVPQTTLWALGYWIICQSCLAYALLTWGNKYASRTLAMSYSVLQPVTAAVLTAILVFPKFYPNCETIDDDDTTDCLEPPGLSNLGAIGVFAGLFLVIYTEPRMADPQNFTLLNEQEDEQQHLGGQEENGDEAERGGAVESLLDSGNGPVWGDERGRRRNLK